MVKLSVSAVWKTNVNKLIGNRDHKWTSRLGKEVSDVTIIEKEGYADLYNGVLRKQRWGSLQKLVIPIFGSVVARVTHMLSGAFKRRKMVPAHLLFRIILP